MDVSSFLSEAELLFTGDPYDGTIADPAHAAIAGEVAGMTTARELAVLNLAARMLPRGECYLEVGSFKGRSICGASRGVTERTFYAIENFVEFGMEGRDARDELRTNLERHCSGTDVRLLEGDAFSVLLDPGVVDSPVGVYFYDGEHTRLSHFLALGIITPLLADEALVLVDDATWPLVQEAHASYMARHTGWSVVRRWDARHNDDREWANGLHALRFRRPPGARRPGLSRDVRLALAAQRRVVGPTRKAAWKALARAPWLVPLAKRLEPKGRHQILGNQQA